MSFFLNENLKLRVRVQLKGRGSVYFKEIKVKGLVMF